MPRLGVGVVRDAVGHQVGAEVGVAEAELAATRGRGRRSPRSGVAETTQPGLGRRCRRRARTTPRRKSRRRRGGAPLSMLQRGRGCRPKVIHVHVLRSYGFRTGVRIRRTPASADLLHESHAPTGRRPARRRRCAIRRQSSSFSTAFMNSSETRTESLAFCTGSSAKPSPSSLVKAGVTQCGGFVLLARLAPDEVADVGMSTSATILAARRAPSTRLDRAGPRVAPRMKLTGLGGGAALGRANLHRPADPRQIGTPSRHGRSCPPWCSSRGSSPSRRLWRG